MSSVLSNFDRGLIYSSNYRCPFVAAVGRTDRISISISRWNAMHQWIFTIGVCLWQWGSTSFLSVNGYTYENRTEQNLIVRIVESKVEVINNEILRSRYCTVEANYW